MVADRDGGMAELVDTKSGFSKHENPASLFDAISSIQDLTSEADTGNITYKL